jgi:murein DD-endopeptidase MepM/ murein hydrolase activator NlpD
MIEQKKTLPQIIAMLMLCQFHGKHFNQGNKQLIKKSTKYLIIPLTLVILISTVACKSDHSSQPSHKPPTPSTAQHNVFITGTIGKNFSNATLKYRIPHDISEQYQRIFSGSIDFNHNTLATDRFNIIYQSEKPHNAILFAQYIHAGHTYNAMPFNHRHQHGFYNLKGQSLGLEFLKSPLHYKYISSPFSLHRMDPILHRIRPHYGVDYAAPIGTPIHSVGNGRVLLRRWVHGFGNTVEVRYNSKDLGLYAHLSKFANIHDGELVKRGQIIGYVGMTGWATGPHLHFGWYVNNKPINPMLRQTYWLTPISNSSKLSFAKAKQQWLTTLKEDQLKHHT